jgi:hypothetical protein
MSKKQAASARDDYFERYISAEERDKIPAEDFAGPDRTYPIRNQEDLKHAAELIGHAADPDAVKAKAKDIAKRKGLALPDAWQEDTEERMTIAAEQPESISFYAPFTRIADDDGKREILGKATRGSVIDTYNTIIAYEASKRAFERAKHIPIREMHQAKAVGKGLQWEGDDANEDILLYSYISRAADDTWTKVEENILTGYSIKGTNAKYGSIVRDGKSIKAITDYDLVEVSLVDNPSCPGCDIFIMRGDGLEDVIASDAEMTEINKETPPAQPETIERAGAVISTANREKLHFSRNALTQMCADAGCTDCAAALNANGDSDGDEAMIDRFMRYMAPVYARSQAMLSDFARRQDDISGLASTVERIASTLGELPTNATFDGVRAEISAVKDQVERMAKTPQAGGPHTGRTATKQLAIDGSSPPQAGDTDLLKQIKEAGVNLTPQQQAILVAGALKRV